MQSYSTESETPPQHILYNLIKLYFTPRFSQQFNYNELITRTLQPQGYTQDALDYRGAYLTLLFLESTGIISSSIDHGHIQASIVRQHFISQLLTEGLWQWAIFVCLQIDDPIVRESAVKEIILRYTPYNAGWEGNKASQEHYLMTKYSINSKLLFEATAYHCKYHHNLPQEIYYLNQCGQYHQAIQLITQDLLPISLQNSNEIFLKSLLNEMEIKYFSEYLPDVVPEHRIFEISEKKSNYSRWCQTGGILLSYLSLMERVGSEILSSDGIKNTDHYDDQEDLFLEAIELFESFRKNYFGICGVKNISEMNLLTKAAVFQIGSNLMEIMFKIIQKERKYFQRFCELLSVSNLPIYESTFLTFKRYETVIRQSYTGQDEEKVSEDDGRMMQ